MASKIINSLAFIALAAAGTAVLAQTSGNGGGVSGGGVSGISGVSGGLGIDFAASQTPGANHEKSGGFTASIDEAMGGPPTIDPACGQLKCK